MGRGKVFVARETHYLIPHQAGLRGLFQPFFSVVIQSLLDVLFPFHDLLQLPFDPRIPLFDVSPDVCVALALLHYFPGFRDL